MKRQEEAQPTVPTLSPEEIAKVAADRAFSAKLITNINRGLIVEAIVSTALGPDWRWCSEDYYRYDFVHINNVRLEVKQSAACQSWVTSKPSIPRWDIAIRKGFYEGEVYTEQPGRNADIYILAWHPVEDQSLADHRDPAQWQFFVIPTTELPPNKTMGMAGARARAEPVGFDELASAVSRVAADLTMSEASGPAQASGAPVSGSAS